jgi:VIT1/CCC1 family predicted Fe2+/Mn2+ transporter
MAGMASEHRRGEMDIQEQVSTFELFNNMTKWGSLFIGALVLLLAMWFCTGAGFGGAAITAVVVVALGVFLLREKPEAATAH